jgi:hypothetical protein
MSILKRWTLAITAAFHATQDEQLKWHSQNQQQLAELKSAQTLAQHDLEAELKKRTLELNHEIALLETKNEAELIMLKTKYQQEIKDYKQYLDSLEQLKNSIQKSYTHLPEAVAFAIHHHAKHLLNQMWETENFADKIKLEMQLIQFMTTVHEDSRLYAKNSDINSLPEKTLALIRGQQN